MATNDTVDLCVPVTSAPRRAALCAAAREDLVVPSIIDFVLAIVSSAACNSLQPSDIRTASTLSTFK